jgi:membrane fusion protein, multidrug efflux system
MRALRTRKAKRKKAQLMSTTNFRIIPTLILGVLSVLLAACGKGTPAPPQMPPPEIPVVSAKAQPVPLTRDLVGRLSATRTADVRARAAGILQKRVYVEGSDVKEGQVLFQIDPAPLRAAYNAQTANLAAAQASYANAKAAADRARAVAGKGLLSKTDLDNAVAAERTTAAALQQAQANVDSAKISLGYTSVTAPISGRSGQQQVTEGALVGQGEATLLTTVEQIDPIYVNFSQAFGDVDNLRRAAASGKVHLADANKAKVELLNADGKPTGVTGLLDFSDTAVDAATGAVSLRASVPNTEHALLPGQYVSVRLTLGDIAHAWLVSQQAVQRDANGAWVFVIGADGKVVQKRITADTLRGSDWIVTDGLAEGDQIAMSGIQSLAMALAQAKPDKPATAKPVPWKPAGDNAASAPPAPEKH